MQVCVGAYLTATNNVTEVLQLLQDHRVFSFFPTRPTFSAPLGSGVGVLFGVFMSSWALGFVRMEVSPSLYCVSHVVYLCPPF